MIPKKPKINPNPKNRSNIVADILVGTNLAEGSASAGQDK